MLGGVNKVHYGQCEHSEQGQLRSTFIKVPSRHIPVLNCLAYAEKTSSIPLVARGKVTLAVSIPQRLKGAKIQFGKRRKNLSVFAPLRRREGILWSM